MLWTVQELRTALKSSNIYRIQIHDHNWSSWQVKGICAHFDITPHPMPEIFQSLKKKRQCSGQAWEKLSWLHLYWRLQTCQLLSVAFAECIEIFFDPCCYILHIDMTSKVDLIGYAQHLWIKDSIMHILHQLVAKVISCCIIWIFKLIHIIVSHWWDFFIVVAVNIYSSDGFLWQASKNFASTEF